MKTMTIALATLLLALGVKEGAALAADQPSPEAELTQQPPPPEAEISAKAEVPDDLLRRAQSARAKAEEQQSRVEQLRRMGGTAYKSGAIRDAEWKAARYEAEARKALELAGGEHAPPLSVEAERYLQLAASFRQIGGAAYKTGLVDWAEAQARKHGAMPVGMHFEPPISTTALQDRPWHLGKPWITPVRSSR